METVERLAACLAVHERIRLAYVFGSTARGQAQPGSDVDVAVLFDAVPPPRALDRLTEELEAAAGRRVDLVVLNTAPPLLAHEVVASGQLVLCRDEDQRVTFEARTSSRVMDTAYLRRVQHTYLHEWAETFRARSS